MGGDSFGFQTSLLGLAAGGDFEIHDSHKSWNSKYTQHFETGIVIHVTSGNVTHNNLNSLEVHATANVLTMHVDVTPLNVHVRPIPIGIDVHIEASKFRKHVNYHGGHHHLLVSNFHQESQAVHIKSTTKQQSGWDKRADLAPSAAAGHEGMMSLEAGTKMTLQGERSIRLQGGGTDDKDKMAALSLSETPGKALLYSKQGTAVHSSTQTSVIGGKNSSILLKNNSLELKSGNTSVSLSPGRLSTNATETQLNGKVTLGQPATSNMASKEDVDAVWDSLNSEVAAEFNDLKGKIQELTNRLSAANIP